MKDKHKTPEQIVVRADEIDSFGLDKELADELRRIQHESNGDMFHYPSPFRELFGYYREDARYRDVEDRIGNSLLTIYYFDPKLFISSVLDYSKNLQKAIFDLREEKTKKVVSKEYWEKIEATHQKFGHLHDYVKEKGLDAVLLNNAGDEEVKSREKEVLHYLKMGRDVSKLYSDLVRYYINLQEPNIILSTYEHRFYRSPEKFIAQLRSFNEKAKMTLGGRNGEAGNINIQNVDYLKRFLNSLPKYGMAYFGKQLKGEEMEVVVGETMQSIDDLLKKHSSMVPSEVEIEVMGVNGQKDKVRIPRTHEVDYPEATKNLEETLEKLGYDMKIRFERSTAAIRVYANRLFRIADSLLKFKRDVLGIDLSMVLEDLKNVGKDIYLDSLMGNVVLIDGKEDPATMSYHLGRICKFLREGITKADNQASQRDEESLEMISEEEYEKHVNKITTVLPDFRPSMMQ